MACDLCGGVCAPGGFSDLLGPDLAWLWEQLAAVADRRGDPVLSAGTVVLKAPHGVAERTAALAVVGPLRPGQRRQVDLAGLAELLSPVPPGAVAAHAVGRRLAVRAAEQARRAADTAAARDRLAAALPTLGESGLEELRANGWMTRLAADAGLVDAVVAVVDRLSSRDGGWDRRVLAAEALGDPHALDRGGRLPAAVLAVLGACGRVPAGLSPREGWAAVGVSYDDLTGGLTMVGVAPAGWALPAGTPVTVPPRVLAGCDWPAGDGTVFVTENPSVLAACLEVPSARVVCTSGTPSAVEVAALGRIADRGWALRVRADFDDAGLAHVAAILAAAPTARAWRMGTGDYRAGLGDADPSSTLRAERLPETPWDPPLAGAMAEAGLAVFEEWFLADLVGDVTGC